MTAETDRSWTFWEGYHDSTFVPFRLIRCERRAGITERWTGKAWGNTAPVSRFGSSYRVGGEIYAFGTSGKPTRGSRVRVLARVRSNAIGLRSICDRVHPRFAVTPAQRAA